MRTAHNQTSPRGLASAVFGFCAGFLVFISAVHAADIAALPVPPPMVSQGAPATVPAQATPASVSDIALKSPLPVPSEPVADKEEKGGRGLANAEDKVTDSVKSIVRHMNTTDNVTLDDLNSARQAVAKIDALIDIEKRLNELEKLRNEREGGRTMSAIPASALIPPASMGMPQGMPSSLPPAFQPSPVMMGGNSMEVSRVTGGGGHYSALMKLPDGQTKTVEVGDHVAGGKVQSITSSGVDLDLNGTRRHIPVKNIEAVFGHSP